VDGTFAAERCAEEAKDERGGDVHELHDGTRDADEDVHRAGDGEGDAFGALQGEGLGDKLAEKHLEVGDEREGEDDGDGMGVDGGVRRKRVEAPAGEAKEHLGDSRLADPAEGEARCGNAKLHGGKEFIDGVLKFECGAGSGTAEGDELLDARFADADEGELGRDEKTGGEDEEGHQDDAKEDPLKHDCSVMGYDFR
jgi:hypothetical protein